MTHLTDRELETWRDRPADADRTNVVAHLAACDACAARYAELVRVAPPDGAVPIDVSAYLQRGREVGRAELKSAGAATPASPLVRWWPALAAAAVIALVVLVPWRPPSVEPPVTRGGVGLGAASPVGPVAVDAARTFRWTASDQKASFRLEVLDSNDAVVYDVGINGALEATLPEDVAASLAAGREYRWSVSRLDARGEIVETSPAARFTIRR